MKERIILLVILGLIALFFITSTAICLSCWGPCNSNMDCEGGCHCRGGTVQTIGDCEY
jgi:hypothetical protein